MKPLRCLIVEDEPLAAEVMVEYIAQVPFLAHAATCRDALYAIDWLKINKADVIFLDLHLPKLKGFDFLKILAAPPQIIVTTAYHQYAVDGYDLNVVDYLMKPIEFSRFLKAVNKLQRQETDLTAEFAFFNVNKKRVKVFWNEILYIESLKEYVSIHTAAGRIVTKYQLGEMMALLPGNGWLRIHRSYIVAVAKIEAFTASEIEISGIKLPIGPAYREDVLRVLGGS
jgi:DNA-binding LytR/AlgR family response regulator